jgi:hypothetical protein
MAFKTGEVLKQHFKFGSRPSEQNFRDLIDSMLNKRDDKFLGHWEEGISCQSGDVVLHEGAIWVVVNGTPEFCSNRSPKEDKGRWRQLVDDDWVVVDQNAETSASVAGENPPTERPSNSDSVLATMHANPRVTHVGIGTDNPSARFEVAENNSGRFLVILDPNKSPALKIVKLKSYETANYLITEVKDDVSFITGSHSSFEFSTEDQSCYNERKSLLRIQPEDFRLDIFGECQSYGFFVNTDQNKLEAEEDLGSMLDKLDLLKPKRFQWKGSTELDTTATQIGFIAQEVSTVLPEAVRISGDDNGEPTMAVAYHTLVPVLVKTMQELKSESQRLVESIKQQESKITKLEERLGQLEKKLSSLEDQSAT